MTTPGGYLSGEILTAANMNLLPAGVETGGYAQAVANQGSITTVTDLTGMAVTFTAVAGRRYKATVQVHVSQTAVDGQYLVDLKEGATVLMEMRTRNASTSERYSNQLVYVSNASITGAKTWKVTLERDSGTATLTAQAAATYPMFILVEDIGEL